MTSDNGATRRRQLLRAVNEQIRELSDGWDVGRFHCECADPDCSEMIPLTTQAFDAAASVAGGFLVAPEHAIRSGARVVLSQESFAVVAAAPAGVDGSW